MLKFFVLLIINLYIFEISAQEKPEPWIFLKVSDGITIHYRIPENSVLKELKLSTTSKTTLTALVSTISDIESVPNWAYLCTKSSIVKVVSKTELYYYYVIGSPWPLTDRDLIIHMKTSQDSITGVVTINTKNHDGLVDRNENYVRIKKMSGSTGT